MEGIDALIEGLVSRVRVRENPHITAEDIRDYSELHRGGNRMRFPRVDRNFDAKIKHLDSWHDVFAILTMPLNSAEGPKWQKRDFYTGG